MAAWPVVRTFTLPAVFDGLLEYAIFITQPISHRQKLHRRHRIEKASREAPEPPVAETGIGFLFDEAQPIEVFLSDGSLHKGIQQEVRDIVCQ